MFLAGLSLALPAFACTGALAAPREELAGPIVARVLRVVDGDTIEVVARIWLDQELTVRVRLDGIDAPELKGRCARERSLAARARELVVEAARDEVQLSRIRYDKYGGRVVARVQVPDGRDLSVAMLGSGLAHAYDGGRKLPWCETAER